ncbi:MAG: di-heme cytochrome-c peroxidase [Myxococcaceae bacterium]|nr:di-heme cytochrome-c peroxidase [Myxococcaceae bacterium]
MRTAARHMGCSSGAEHFCRGADEMRKNDAALVAAGAFLCALGMWCDAGCGGDIERETHGSKTERLEDLHALTTIAVPEPAGTEIVDTDAAIVLGKAFFWDQQAGSDGITACASCHATAGADSRRFNIVNPGPNGVFEACGTNGPSQSTTPCNGISDDRIGSQGVAASSFVSIASDTTSAVDVCTPLTTGTYGSARQVTARNAPSIVGAALYRDAFWDGRARHTLHGVDPMACGGRPVDGPNSLAEKLLARQPLQLQRVSVRDSVLGGLSAAPNRGLNTTYRDLLIKAFGNAASGNAVMTKFSTFWGQSILAYESTLIPNQTPFDAYLSGNKSALTANQQRGLDRFMGRAGCAKCHAGSELSDATVSFAAARGVVNDDGGDQGFHNVGVRPSEEDVGRAGTGPNRGAFKTPQLRNVKLTAPYFHNGGKATLRSVVELYAAGGDFANAEKSRHVKRLRLEPRDVDALVDFLTNGLTDCRTEKERAPFDHPSLAFPDGPTLAAVGADGTGSCPRGPQTPLDRSRSLTMR